MDKIFQSKLVKLKTLDLKIKNLGIDVRAINKQAQRISNIQHRVATLRDIRFRNLISHFPTNPFSKPQNLSNEIDDIRSANILSYSKLYKKLNKLFVKWLRDKKKCTLFAVPSDDGFVLKVCLKQDSGIQVEKVFSLTDEERNKISLMVFDTLIKCNKDKVLKQIIKPLYFNEFCEFVDGLAKLHLNIQPDELNLIRKYNVVLNTLNTNSLEYRKVMTTILSNGIIRTYKQRYKTLNISASIFERPDCSTYLISLYPSALKISSIFERIKSVSLITKNKINKLSNLIDKYNVVDDLVNAL